MINEKLKAIYYGGDYNPDQWPEEIWKEDMELFKKANINIITIPVFSWAKLQPSENKYDFEWLDKILDLAYENGIHICLATSTAAQPAWMSKKYPEILPVDIEGRKRTHGARVNFCPNSGIYRKFSKELVKKLAERYKNHPGLLVWHIGNEYGNYCYCDNCAEEFRNWTKSRYKTIEELNKRWYLSFWGHTIYDWDEIVPPSYLNEMGKTNWEEKPREYTCFQGISLDYNRFMSDSVLACYSAEYEIIKKISPNVPITTNLMGTFKSLDYFKWAKKMDIISWDNYPAVNEDICNIALRHDLMRGLKDGAPFMLMEQTPSQQNWQAYNNLKRPGVMRLFSYQAIAHGADTVMFFQLRRSFGACEKYHGAFIEHVGNENTRVYKECSELGQELQKLGDKLLDSRLKSKVAIIFDWENWWAVEFSSGPSVELKYIYQIQKYYKALHNQNISVDIVSSESDFAGYEILIAPILYMIKPGVAANIERFVKRGGIFVTTFFSGIVNENDLVTLGGYPGELRKLLGIWSEEIDALPPDMENSIIMKEQWGNLKGEYKCNKLFDIINLESARSLAVYKKDFYAGKSAMTCNDYGKGKSYYIATDPEEKFIKNFIKNVCDEKGIAPALNVPEGVEVTKRYKNNKEFTFILNHNESEVKINLKNNKYLELLSDKMIEKEISLKAKDLLILEKDI